MYAIQYYKMFVNSKDGGMTDSKSYARLFDTIGEAYDFAVTWARDGFVRVRPDGVPVVDAEPINIVEVDVKVVLKSVRQVVRTL